MFKKQSEGSTLWHDTTHLCKSFAWDTVSKKMHRSELRRIATVMEKNSAGQKVRPWDEQLAQLGTGGPLLIVVFLLGTESRSLQPEGELHCTWPFVTFFPLMISACQCHVVHYMMCSSWVFNPILGELAPSFGACNLAGDFVQLLYSRHSMWYLFSARNWSHPPLFRGKEEANLCSHVAL